MKSYRLNQSSDFNETCKNRPDIVDVRNHKVSKNYNDNVINWIMKLGFFEYPHRSPDNQTPRSILFIFVAPK